MSGQARCEPPEGTPVRSLHLVQSIYSQWPISVVWWGGSGDATEWLDPRKNTISRAHTLADEGYRYLMPVPSPADLTALVLAGRKFIGTGLEQIGWIEDCRALRTALAAFSHIQEPSP